MYVCFGVEVEFSDCRPKNTFFARHSVNVTILTSWRANAHENALGVRRMYFLVISSFSSVGTGTPINDMLKNFTCQYSGTLSASDHEPGTKFGLHNMAAVVNFTKNYSLPSMSSTLLRWR